MAARALPEQSVLLQLLRYEPETGKLFWKERGPEWFKNEWMAARWNSRYAGKEAFTAFDASCGYFRGTLHGTQFLAHRVIIKMMTGSEPPQIDHIDGDGSNNSWGNLRPATYESNVRNRAIVANNTSGTMGVVWHKKAKKWEARISDASGRRIHLGLFSALEGAVAARRDAERKYGFHRNHGRQSRRLSKSTRLNPIEDKQSGSQALA